MRESLKIDAPRAETTSSTRGQPEAGTPDKQDVDDFQKAMEQSDDQDRGETFQRQDEPQQPGKRNMSDFRQIIGQTGSQEQAGNLQEQAGAHLADRSVSDKFHQSMKQTEKHDQQERGHQSENSGPEPQSMSMGVGELFKNHRPFPAPAAPAENSAPNFELAEKLVSRILVNQDNATGHEVRLQLGADILPDTEIRLIKGSDGMLQVMLLSDNKSSFQTLVAAQDTLKMQLEKFETNVRVDVSMHTQEENNDSQRRSRGYIPEIDEDR